MLDINGQELNVGDEVQILCQVLSIDEDGVRTRILNSEQELLTPCSQDEVIGLHASSELTKFSGAASPLPMGEGFDDSDDYDKSAAGIAERMAETIMNQHRSTRSA